MFTAALTTIKKLFRVNVDVKEAPKRPLEEESENEFEEFTFNTTEPKQKKRCLHVDQGPLTPSNDLPTRPLLKRFPWLTWKKEENQLPDIKMSNLWSEKQKDGTGGEIEIVEKRLKKRSGGAPSATSLSASLMSEQEDDVRFLEKREAKSVSELATCRPPLNQSLIAGFRFVPSSTLSTESDFPAKQKNYSNRSRSSVPFPSKTKSDSKGHPRTVLDRLLGKRRSTGILSSRIKHSVVQKSFLHEEKMKYRQLLQQYTEHYLTPRSKNFSHKVSSISSSSPMGMVSRSQWTPLQTKERQEHIENASSSIQMLPSSDNSMLEGVLGSKKIVGGEGSLDRYKKQPCNPVYVPLIDISKEGDEENSSDKESNDDSVILIKEVLSPQAQKNSLEERLQEHPIYDLEWVKDLRKEYEGRAHNAKKDADSTSKYIQELEQRRTQKVSLDEKVTERLKLLDLTYPSKYTEIPDEEEEEEKAFVPLTLKMENEVDNALKKTPVSEVLVEKFHIQITRRDIRTLNGLNWLNDEVINFYMNLIMERSQKNDNYPNVYAFNTFFYPKLSKSGYQSVRRWTRKVNLFSHDMLLIPIHLGMHWCMSVVDFKMKCITYYDSMLGNNEWCLQCLLEYLEEEHRDKKGSPYSTSVWKLENKKGIPQQMNGSDCGMFACKFADYLSRCARINFDQEHMPYFRRRMVYEIINARLL